MFAEVFLRTQYNYDMDEASLDSGLSMSYIDPVSGEIVEDKGFTQQEFALESDINEIVRRFGLTGKLPEGIAMPQSGDFTGVDDYFSAVLAVRKADESFMLLPGELRARFHHDPQELLEFLEDGKNLDEAIKLGLVSKTPPVPRSAVDAIDELAAKWTASVPKAAS